MPKNVFMVCMCACVHVSLKQWSGGMVVQCLHLLFPLFIAMVSIEAVS